MSEPVALHIPERSFLQRVLSRLGRSLRVARWRRKFASFGATSDLQSPAYIVGAANISIGERAQIWMHARLEARAPEGIVLRIGDGCKIQPYVHIGAIESVDIGEGVLMGSFVYITDHDHDISRPEEPPITNRRVVTAPVRIEDYAWLGEKAIVLKGVTVGTHSIVGAGSVVTRDIPPWSIAVGSPARVVSRYDHQSRVWVKSN